MSPDEVIRKNERILFRIEAGELMRVFIIRREGKIILHIMAHHLIGDGKSIVCFIENIMTSLAGEKNTYKPMVLLNDATLPENCKLPFTIKTLINVLNQKWKKTGRSFSFADYYLMYNKYWEGKSSVIRTEKFSSEETINLIAKAKSMGVSLNSLIIAISLKSDRNAKTVGMAVNGRIDNNRSMANQASGISIALPILIKTIDENANIVHNKVQMKLKNVSKKYFLLKFMSHLSPTLIDSIFMYANHCYENKATKSLCKIIGYNDKNDNKHNITNLTRLDIPSVYGEYSIKNCVFVLPVISNAKHVFGVATLSDELIVTYHYMNDSKMKSVFFDKVIDNLRDLIS